MSDRAGSIETFLSEIKALIKKAEQVGLKNLTIEEKDKLLWYYHEFDLGKNRRVSINLN